ncbi:MAG: GNAT family N-acetyltransferase [Gilvibacter sp.]
MQISFLFLEGEKIYDIVPMLQELGGNKYSDQILKERLGEMISQNYRCLGIFDQNKLVGMCGLWYQTRHYAGKSLEVDHVFITAPYRNKGIGKNMIAYVQEYGESLGCEAIELNTYVENFPSHKFYYNLGFVARGFHFLKRF